MTAGLGRRKVRQAATKPPVFDTEATDRMRVGSLACIATAGAKAPSVATRGRKASIRGSHKPGSSPNGPLSASKRQAPHALLVGTTQGFALGRGRFLAGMPLARQWIVNPTKDSFATRGRKAPLHGAYKQEGSIPSPAAGRSGKRD